MIKINKKRILVVDDEPSIQRALRRNLAVNGYEVFVAEDGKQAVEIAVRQQPDLILLDLCLPGELDGLDVCKQIRHIMQKTPIIVLSAVTEEKQKIRALDLGADDYLTKPFSNEELQARVRACLRRANIDSQVAEQNIETLRSEDENISIDIVRRQVRVGEQEVRLTPTEFELLHQLLLYAGKVLTHRSLLQAVWGPEYGEEADYLRVYIRQLRVKVEADPSRPKYILTEPGIGYVFRSPTDFSNV
ncbi:MAG: response regulator transcription factor [Ktedonobacteraceae bacterium]